MKNGSPGILVLVLVASCGEESTVEFRSVEPVCVEEAPADDDWACGEVRSVTCEDAADQDIELHVQLAPGDCDDADLQPVDGPFGPGRHEVAIEDDASDDTVCTATLEVIDDDAPVIETETIQLWPPNHKMHEISLLDDCVVDVDECDPDWTTRIVAVSSDEPDNDIGDGNHEPDIQPVDDDTVSLRSERQGGSNGRVYTIDFEVEDGSGNVAEEVCIVAVVHDQSGIEAVDDGPAQTVPWPDA